MNELQAVAQAAHEALRRGQEALLATVVRVQGSTYRRPGARLLLTGEGWAAGSVSGGCLEKDLLQKAWWRTENGPTVVTYDSTSADEDIAWGFGLGCNGVVEVLLERLTPERVWPLERLRGWADARQEGVLATVIRTTAPAPAPAPVGERLALDRGGVAGPLRESALAPRLLDDAREALEERQSRWRRYGFGAEGALEIFFEYAPPPQALVIVGAGHDAIPLVTLAKAHLGWHVTLLDTRSTGARPPRFSAADRVVACPPSEVTGRIALDAQTAVVVMTHHYADDRAVLSAVLATDAGYIGVLGPRRRTERLLEEAGVALAPEAAVRLHAPVGLDIGADNAEEIALAVVAEIHAWRARRPGAPLRARSGPIHEPACPA